MTCTRFAALVTLGALQIFLHADAALATDTGQELYRSVCSACHSPQNVMVSAPKAGDVAEWGARLSRGVKGLDTLTDNAVNGFATMPPRGGGNSELSRDQFRQAIEFMMTPCKSTKPSCLQ